VAIEVVADLSDVTTKSISRSEIAAQLVEVTEITYSATKLLPESDPGKKR
jgi:hypothetical protein